MEYQVIVNPVTGAHYDCESLAEANEIFDFAPVAEAGDRLLTIDGVITRREFMEAA